MKKQVHIISHTHWDREWYLSFPKFRNRLVDLVDNLLALLEGDPQFKYFHLDGQTIMLQDYLQLRPSQAARLKKQIAAGRIIIGPWYLQNDELLTSGESTVRNLLLGRRMCREYGASPMPVAYLPDQFGHIGQLPQIARGFGLEYAVMGRGIDLPTRGRAEYVWRAPDGSAVLVLAMPRWYNNAQRLPEEPGDAMAILRKVVEELEPFVCSGHYLLMNGVDHLEAQENLTRVLENLKKHCAAELAGLELMHSRLEDYVQQAGSSLGWDGRRAAQLSVPELVGELREGRAYFAVSHTLSSRVYLKQENVRLSTVLEAVLEPLQTLRVVTGIGGPDRELLDYLWRRLLENHPHDSICGCSVDVVHEDMMSRWREVREILEDGLAREFHRLVRRAQIAGLAQEDQLLLLFNPSQEKTSSWVEAKVFIPRDCGETFALESLEGRPVPYTILRRKPGCWRSLSPVNLPGVIQGTEFQIGFFAEDLPPYGLAFYRVRVGQRAVIQWSNPWGGATLENDLVQVTVRENGTIDLLDKRTQNLFAGCLLLEDGGDAGNTYLYRPPIRDELYTSYNVRGEVKQVLRTPDVQRCVISFTWDLPQGLVAGYQERSTVKVPVPFQIALTLAKNSRRVDVEITCQHRIRDHRLRLVFPTMFSSVRGKVVCDQVLAGVQYDVVTRPVPTVEGVDPTKVHPSWHWLALVKEGQAGGLGVFHEGLHEYGFTRIDGRVGLAITLLRAVEWLSGEPMGQYPYLLEEERVPGAQCQGVHTFRLALSPFGGDGEEEKTALYREANQWLAGIYAYSYPLDRFQWETGRPWRTDFPEKTRFLREDGDAELPCLDAWQSLLELRGEGVVLSAIKPPENGNESNSLVIRCFNLRDFRTEGQLVLPTARIKGAWRLNLAEEKQAPLSPQGSGVSFFLEPREIVTIQLEMEPLGT